MAFEAVLTSLAGVQIAPLEKLRGRRLDQPFNGLDSFSFSVRREHPYAQELHERALDHDGLIKLYEVRPEYDGLFPGGKRLLFHGPLTSTEKQMADTGGGTVALTALGPFWRLAYRLIGKSRAGTSFSSQDRGQIVSTALATANGEGETGIQMGAIEASAASAAGPLRFKKLAELVGELSAALDGFDWEVVPLEYAAGKIGELRIYAAAGAETTVNFEYGEGTQANVRSYTHRGDPSGLLNRAWSLPPGFPSGDVDAISESDATAIGLRGLFEDVVQTDLQVEDLRRKLLQAHVALRKAPKQWIEITPHSYARESVPVYLRDFVRGDIVGFRARELGRLAVDVRARVRDVSLTINDNDTAVAAPRLTP